LPPTPTEFTSTIAERELILVLDTGKRSLILRLGQPVQDVQSVNAMDWRCPVQLIGRETENLPAGFGVDSLQALINAIRIARIELDALERETGGRVQWLDQPSHDLPDWSLGSTHDVNLDR
jgi:hypothetical protein